MTGPIEGAYGEVYSITLPENTFPRRIAAKRPRIKRFGTREQARSGIEQVLHELEKTHRVFMVPWINRFFDVQIIHGWPFILSRFRDGSLEDLISNPLAWTVSDRLASVILVARMLRFASERGIAAHQDLKPGNVFFDDFLEKMCLRTARACTFTFSSAISASPTPFATLDATRAAAPIWHPNSSTLKWLTPRWLPRSTFSLWQ